MLLPSGKALIAGGFSSGDARSGEIYDPASGAFAVTASQLSVTRAIPGVTQLKDGRVLIAGGQSMTGPILTAVDLYAE